MWTVVFTDYILIVHILITSLHNSVVVRKILNSSMEVSCHPQRDSSIFIRNQTTSTRCTKYKLYDNYNAAVMYKPESVMQRETRLLIDQDILLFIYYYRCCYIIIIWLRQYAPYGRWWIVVYDIT